MVGLDTGQGGALTFATGTLKSVTLAGYELKDVPVAFHQENVKGAFDTPLPCDRAGRGRHHGAAHDGGRERAVAGFAGVLLAFAARYLPAGHERTTHRAHCGHPRATATLASAPIQRTQSRSSSAMVSKG